MYVCMITTGAGIAAFRWGDTCCGVRSYPVTDTSNGLQTLDQIEQYNGWCGDCGKIVLTISDTRGKRLFEMKRTIYACEPNMLVHQLSTNTVIGSLDYNQDTSRYFVTYPQELPRAKKIMLIVVMNTLQHSRPPLVEIGVETSGVPY
jgi:hypothetical protein